ncbi:Cytochrome c551 peroxidase [hydrothermal vent metagenome]|uniref:Cytochrome c551 peroxidase n=1 Tax=hydrothermal vent metagenome TaxID=652676 RepID=A0A3B0RWA9_9ZZZZ
MMRNTKTLSALLAGAIVSVTAASIVYAQTKVPPLAPLGDPPIPLDNPMSEAKTKLGKMLFWDPRLGGDASTSCVTCHEPDQGWGFADALSRGYPGTVHWRNSQTVINSAYLNKLFWAGSASSLEKQAPSAAKGAVAGNGENDVMEARLAFIPTYRKLFKEVFGTEWPLISDAWKAIAAFERTLIVKDTPVDKYLAGDKKALNAQQINGLKLFNNKAGCLACHNGALATDQKYYNLGVPPAERWLDDGLAQVTFRYELYAKGVTQDLYRKLKDDPGFYFRSKEKADFGKFRTAPLRYIKYTAPYMHNGAFWDLKEVVEFYNAGGGQNDFTDGTISKTKTPLLKPLGLSEKEVDDLVAFLEAFSGDELAIEAPKLPDYAPLPNPSTN